MSSRASTSIPLLALAYGLSAVANFVLSIAVGRKLGAAALGAYALAVSSSRILCAAADLGIGPHLTRSVTRSPDAASRLFPLFVSFRSVFVPITAVVTVLVGLAFGHRSMLVFMFVGATQGLVMVQLLCDALLLANHRQRTSAALTVISSGLVAIGTVLWYAADTNLSVFTAIYFVTTLAGIWVWMFAVRNIGVSPRWHLDRSLGTELARSWPIGVSVLLGIAALKSPVLVVSAFGSPADVGAFSAVDMVVTACAIFQSAVTSATFPRLAGTYHTDPVRYRRIFWMSNALLAVAGVVMGAFLITLGGPILARVFPGHDFSRLRTLMPIAGWSTPCLLLAHHNIFIFAASDRERVNLALMIGWFVIILGAQLALVPTLGIEGAAWGLTAGRLLGLGLIGGALFRFGLHRGSLKAA